MTSAQKQRETTTEESVGRYSIRLLLLVVILSSLLLVTINYYTIEVLSGLRAYTAGESLYSKGRQSATKSLVLYLYNGEEAHWERYERWIRVPIGDRRARENLEAGKRGQEVREHFLQGRNHPDDIDDIIWLYEWFHDAPFMEKALSIWRQGDEGVAELDELAREVRREIAAEGALSADRRQAAIQRLNALVDRLTELEIMFSSTLGSAARQVNSYLFCANIVLTLVIIGSVGAYASKMMLRQRRQNRELVAANRELDRFLYSASHDLRAPISSLLGLIEIARLEREPEQVQSYLRLMRHSLEHQDEFIREIIDFAQNKRRDVEFSELSLRDILQESVEQHRFLMGAGDVKIFQDIQVDKVRCDALRLRIICNNLVSNAYKYSDPEKERRVVTLRTYAEATGRCFSIVVEDNGIGIAEKHKGRIFDMFYATVGEEKGSGLGLYIAQETAKRLGGSICFDSEPGTGSVFTVRLPIQQ